MNDERIIAYLLKELPDEETERFEDECFARESWPTEIALVEEDLIDAYLRHELAPGRRRRFEENYLITEVRLERVSSAAALLRHIDERNVVSQTPDVLPLPIPMPETTRTGRSRAFWNPQSWAFRAAAAMAVVAVSAVVLYFIFLRPTPPRTFAALTLTISHSNRAEGVQAGQIKLPPDAAGLKISLTLPQPSPAAARYRVEVENENAQKMPVEVVGQEDQALLIVVPAAQLARGQYAVKLFALQADGTEQRVAGSYFFIVR